VVGIAIIAARVKPQRAGVGDRRVEAAPAQIDFGERAGDRADIAMSRRVALDGPRFANAIRSAAGQGVSGGGKLRNARASPRASRMDVSPRLSAMRLSGCRRPFGQENLE
jgi:hypothetical protein